MTTVASSTFAPERGPYAEETALKIDNAVKQLLAQAHQTARGVLKERRAALDRVAERLLEKEVIEAEELKTLLDSTEAQSGNRTFQGL